MKHKILLIGTIALPALLASAGAVDLFGNWIAKLPGMQGTVETVSGMQAIAETVFSFEPDGTRLTGTVSEPHGRFAIKDGKINGDEISFVVIRNLAGKEVKIVYKGKVSLNEIKFTREFQGVMVQPQEFVAKREFLRHNDYIPRPTYAPVQPPNRIR